MRQHLSQMNNNTRQTTHSTLLLNCSIELLNRLYTNKAQNNTTQGISRDLKFYSMLSQCALNQSSAQLALLLNCSIELLNRLYTNKAQNNTTQGISRDLKFFSMLSQSALNQLLNQHYCSTAQSNYSISCKQTQHITTQGNSRDLKLFYALAMCNIWGRSYQVTITPP